MYKDHTNTNGLVDGNIPAGIPCPFEDVCNWKMDHCPTKDNLKQINTSCAAARAHSLVKNMKGRSNINGG